MERQGRVTHRVLGIAVHTCESVCIQWYYRMRIVALVHDVLCAPFVCACVVMGRWCGH